MLCVKVEDTWMENNALSNMFLVSYLINVQSKTIPKNFFKGKMPFLIAFEMDH